MQVALHSFTDFALHVSFSEELRWHGISAPLFFMTGAGEQRIVACPVRSRWLGANHAVRWEAWVSGTGPKQNVAVYRNIGSRAKRGTHGFVDLQMSRIIVLRSGTTRHSYLCTVDSSLYSSSFDVSSRKCAKDGMFLLELELPCVQDQSKKSIAVGCGA